MNCPNCKTPTTIETINGRQVFSCLSCDFFHYTPSAEHAKVQSIFAFVCSDEHGNESIPAFETEFQGLPGSQLKQGIIPMMSAHWNLIEKMRPIARQIADDGQVKVRLMKFSGCEVLEEIRS